LRPIYGMYPALTVRFVEEPATLREFMATLGEDALYAFDRRVVGVLVNDRRLWPSARLKPGDRVVVFPIIAGG
jgi:molybdopterin converting factor small subunit